MAVATNFGLKCCYLHYNLVIINHFAFFCSMVSLAEVRNRCSENVGVSSTV